MQKFTFTAVTPEETKYFNQQLFQWPTRAAVLFHTAISISERTRWGTQADRERVYPFESWVILRFRGHRHREGVLWMSSGVKRPSVIAFHCVALRWCDPFPPRYCICKRPPNRVFLKSVFMYAYSVQFNLKKTNKNTFSTLSLYPFTAFQTQTCHKTPRKFSFPFSL